MHTKSSVLRIFSWSLACLVTLAILAAALPQPVQAACAETHVVKGGETIYRIARTYQVTVNRLAKTNGLQSPYTLTVGQSLCIPDIQFSSPNAKWSVSYSGDQVKITGSGFKKNYTFYVRARLNDASAWYKLDKLQTEKDGTISDAFKLPKELQRKVSLIVCLKDGSTDALTCKQAFRQ